MRIIKRFIGFVLCLSIMLSIASVGIPFAFAAEETTFISGKYDDALYDLVYNGLKQSSASINVSAFNVDAEDAIWVYTAVVNNHPDLFYVNGGFGYSVWGKYIYSFAPAYNYSGQTLINKQNEYESMITDVVSRFENMSGAQAVVAVNDYIVANYRYDTEGLQTGTEVRDVYNMLLQKKAVCQGYALLFLDIMTRLGIDCACVASNDMLHQWNMVEVCNKWYHVDTTRNDPIGAPDGYVFHDYLLLSDRKMLEKGYYNWARVDNGVPTCTDTNYDNYGWDENISQLVSFKDNWYGITNSANGMNITEIGENGSSVVYNQNDRWHVWGNPNYIYPQSIATSTSYKNWLIYHTEDKLYCYDAYLRSAYYLCNLDTTDGYVYYICADDGLVTYKTSTTPNNLTNAVQKQISITGLHYSGDVDNSGTINSTDILKASQVLLDLATPNSLEFAESDQKSGFNSADVLYIKQLAIGLKTPTVLFN